MLRLSSVLNGAKDSSVQSSPVGFLVTLTKFSFENAAFSEDTDTPWPCDVYDLQGRRVARNETPATLRHNHPGLPKGVYIFGHLKVVIK